MNTVKLNTILRLPAVIKRTGLSKSSIYAFIANRKFPRPISLGERAVGWSEYDIDRWIECKILESAGK
ncbi:MAG: AlpA family transcriptional regulator [Kangiella sp.]|nr:MAG: AlpA family transcriptional regulator [Kangiella sp.]